jgi:hypothetical protein
LFHLYIFVRFEAFTAVTMKNVVFWDVALCRSCVNRCFGGTYRLHLQGRKIRERGIRNSLQPPAHAGSSLANFSTLKMEPIRSSEKSVHTRSTRRHIPEEGILHSHRCENLKSFVHSIYIACLIRFVTINVCLVLQQLIQSVTSEMSYYMILSYNIYKGP